VKADATRKGGTMTSRSGPGDGQLDPGL